MFFALGQLVPKNFPETGKNRDMRYALLILALVAAIAPQPARAILTAVAPADGYCSVQSDAVVRMPCAQQTPQIQTVRLALLRTLVPMDCHPVGVHFELAGLPLAPGRAAGLIASAIFRAPTRTAQVEQMCQPTRW